MHILSNLDLNKSDSLNDTIVNFDRIRENIPAFKQKALEFVVNRSINDVLSRTVLTSVTTLIAVACLYFIGTGVIKDLAFTLAIGVVVGTYSSIYVSANALLTMGVSKEDLMIPVREGADQEDLAP